MHTPDSSAVPRWGIPPVICCRGPPASPLCFDIIACRPTHPSFKFQPSAIELFRSMLPDCGTLCRWTSRRRRQYLFSGNVWRPISSAIISLNLLLCLCSDCHFGHYNRSFLLTFYLLTQCCTSKRFRRAKKVNFIHCKHAWIQCSNTFRPKSLQCRF